MDLPDSTPLATHGTALRARLAESGVLLFRRWLDVDALTRLRGTMLDELAKHGWLEKGRDPIEGRPGSPKRLEGHRGWWDGYRAVQRLEAFHAAAHQPVVISMLGELFGEPPLVHPRKIARIIYPQDAGATTPPHQDFPLIGGTVDFVTLWIPLGDTPASKGGLRVLPGSHLRGMRTLHVDQGLTGAPSMWVDVIEAQSDWATFDYEVGDAILFHSLVVHAGSPNRSDRLRLSLDFRYQPASEPIARANLYAHLPPHTGDLTKIDSWNELADGWSTKDWVEAPVGATITDVEPVNPSGMIGGNAGKRNGASRFVDSAAFAEQVAEQPVLVDLAGSH